LFSPPHDVEAPESALLPSGAFFDEVELAIF